MFRVSRALLSLTALLVIAAGGQAQDKGKGGYKEGEVKGRRCAFLGQWGSFHLIGTGGSAAYFLNNLPFSADLRWTEDDADFYYYEPANGDPVTTGWAFARKPNACGLHSVWRHDGRGWQIFERVRAWGNFDRGISGSAQKTSLPIDQRVTDLETDMGKVKEKLQIK